MDKINFEELIAQYLTPYSPVDLGNLRPNTTIQTARELDKEAKVLGELLSDKKNDWSKRLKGIQNIQAVFVTHDLLRMPQIYAFLNKIAEGLSQQLFDLRSTITKEACKTISLIAEVLESEFELIAGNVFVTENSLFKLMESGTAIMAQHAHMSMLSILYNTNASRVIKNIMRQSKDKHQYIRQNIVEYITIVLQMYPKQLLDKYKMDFMEYLQGALADTHVEVRKKARIAFMKYHSVYVNLGQQLIQGVDYTYQKAVYDEYMAIGIDPESVFQDNDGEVEVYENQSSCQNSEYTAYSGQQLAVSQSTHEAPELGLSREPFSDNQTNGDINEDSLLTDMTGKGTSMVLTVSTGAPLQGQKPQTTKNNTFTNPYVTKKSGIPGSENSERYRSPNSKASAQWQRRGLKIKQPTETEEVNPSYASPAIRKQKSYNHPGEQKTSIASVQSAAQKYMASRKSPAQRREPMAGGLTKAGTQTNFKPSNMMGRGSPNRLAGRGSPQRNVTGRGSPLPSTMSGRTSPGAMRTRNNNVQSKINTGLGNRGSPKRVVEETRIKTPSTQQMTNYEDHGSPQSSLGKTQNFSQYSKRNAGTVASLQSTKLSPTTKLDQLKKSHYPQGRRSPQRVVDTGKTPQAPVGGTSKIGNGLASSLKPTGGSQLNQYVNKNILREQERIDEVPKKKARDIFKTFKKDVAEQRSPQRSRKIDPHDREILNVLDKRISETSKSTVPDINLEMVTDTDFQTPKPDDYNQPPEPHAFTEAPQLDTDRSLTYSQSNSMNTSIATTPMRRSKKERVRRAGQTDPRESVELTESNDLVNLTQPIPPVVHEVISALETTEKKPEQAAATKPMFEGIKMSQLNLKDNSPSPDNISIGTPGVKELENTERKPIDKSDLKKNILKFIMTERTKIKTPRNALAKAFSDSTEIVRPPSMSQNQDVQVLQHAYDLEKLAKQPSLFNQNRAFLNLSDRNFPAIAVANSDEKVGIIQNAMTQIKENFQNLTELILQFQLIQENDVITSYSLDRASDIFIQSFIDIHFEVFEHYDKNNFKTQMLHQHVVNSVMSLFELCPDMIQLQHLRVLIPWTMKTQASKSLEFLSYKVIEFFTKNCPSLNSQIMQVILDSIQNSTDIQGPKAIEFIQHIHQNNLENRYFRKSSNILQIMVVLLGVLHPKMDEKHLISKILIQFQKVNSILFLQACQNLDKSNQIIVESLVKIQIPQDSDTFIPLEHSHIHSAALSARVVDDNQSDRTMVMGEQEASEQLYGDQGRVEIQF